MSFSNIPDLLHGSAIGSYDGEKNSRLRHQLADDGLFRSERNLRVYLADKSYVNRSLDKIPSDLHGKPMKNAIRPEKATDGEEVLGGEKRSVVDSKLLLAADSSSECSSSESEETQQPGCTGRNVLKTVAAYITFFGGGMGNSIFGATILQLERQTGSTTQQIAPIFLYRALGSFFGTSLVALLFNRLPPEALLAAGCLGLAAMNSAIPFCTSFAMLMAVTVVHGLSHGIVGGGCNSYVVKTWKLKAPPFVQGLHFVTSFGSMITPLVVDMIVPGFHTVPSVARIPSNNLTTTPTETNNTIALTGEISPPIRSLRVNSTTNDTESTADVNLLIPFVMAACVVALGAFTFILSLFMDILTFKKQSGSRGESFVSQQREDTKPLRSKSMFALILVMIAVYSGMESTYGAWILAFVVKQVGGSFKSAALVCTSYWGALAGGRAVSIITSRLFRPETLIIICLIGSTISLATLTFACNLHLAVTWACSIVVGLSFSSIYGNTISFCQRELGLSGVTTSVTSLSLYVGFMSMPAVVGILFANYTPMFFPYILLGGSVVITVVYTFVLYYVKTWLK